MDNISRIEKQNRKILGHLKQLQRNEEEKKDNLNLNIERKEKKVSWHLEEEEKWNNGTSGGNEDINEDEVRKNLFHERFLVLIQENQTCCTNHPTTKVDDNPKQEARPDSRAMEANGASGSEESCTIRKGEGNIKTGAMLYIINLY